MGEGTIRIKDTSVTLALAWVWQLWGQIRVFGYSVTTRGISPAEGTTLQRTGYQRQNPYLGSVRLRILARIELC